MSNTKKKSELIELNQRYGLWLKAIARLHITVIIAKIQLLPGKAITAHEIIEKLKAKANHPFTNLKVLHTSLRSFEFEGRLNDDE